MQKTHDAGRGHMEQACRLGMAEDAIAGMDMMETADDVMESGEGYAINLSKQAKKTKLFKIRHVKRTTLKKLAFRGYVDANFVSLCGYC